MENKRRIYINACCTIELLIFYHALCNCQNPVAVHMQGHSGILPHAERHDGTKENPSKAGIGIIPTQENF
jgi:hypothetical protein